ncbi:hypothetical protein CYMTET_5445 [Cymbomonas tetramitiformis]|uniref:Uncharacterized protein n=1 Tax=Cymbomonas tetramitiformis TaxID=36881 RepID=A0AAE0GZ38_9CHLO|nr:hypothetical protein CYMTET_5445 [Cymbomonas tetramitiformis]
MSIVNTPSDAQAYAPVCNHACCCQARRDNDGRYVVNGYQRVRAKIPAELVPFLRNHRVQTPSGDKVSRGVYSGLTFADMLFEQDFADAKTDAGLLRDIENIVREPRESAGYVLTDAYGVKADELQVINRGLTFEEEPRLGVTPVDHTDSRHAFSVRDSCQKRELACFHCHPSVIRDHTSWAYAPPSFEDGAVLLTTLTRSTRHLIFGYTGVYVLEKLNGPGWTAAQRNDRCQRCLRARARRNGLTNFDVRLATERLLRWQDTFDFGKGADAKLLNLLRSCRFTTQENLHDYFTVFVVLFAGNIFVDYHPFATVII